MEKEYELEELLNAEEEQEEKQDDKEVIKQVHIYLPLSLHEQVKKKAKDDCTGVATYIRKVLNHHVNKK